MFVGVFDVKFVPFKVDYNFFCKLRMLLGARFDNKWEVPVQ